MKKFWKKEETAEVKTPLEEEYDAVVDSLAAYAADSDEYGKAAANLGLVGDEKRKEAEANKPEKKELWIIRAGKRIFETVTDPKVLSSVIAVAGGICYSEFCAKRRREGELGQVEEMRDYKTKW